MASTILWAFLGTQFIFSMTALGASLVFFMPAGAPRMQDALQRGAAGKERLLFTAITLHNIPEGMAVGLAFALAADGEGLAAALALALGIGVQNFPEGAAVSLPLRQLGPGRAFLCGAASGAVEPVFGLLAFGAARWVHPLMPWLLSFSAGAMLYVTAHELCPAAADRTGSLGFIGGFALMMALDVALG